MSDRAEGSARVVKIDHLIGGGGSAYHHTEVQFFGVTLPLPMVPSSDVDKWDEWCAEVNRRLETHISHKTLDIQYALDDADKELSRKAALCERMADHVRYFVNDGMSLHKLTTGTKEQMQKDLAEFDREAGK